MKLIGRVIIVVLLALAGAFGLSYFSNPELALPEAGGTVGRTVSD